MTSAARLLLLDLDGVLVLEGVPPLTAGRELLRLHPDLALLDALDMPMAVLTHRSRREAERILAAIGFNATRLVAVVSAQDILSEALRQGDVLVLLRGGLAKRHALSLIERTTGIGRNDIAMIDDRDINLRSLLDAGLGYALLAPSAVAEDGASLTTFELEQAVEHLSNGCLRRGSLMRLDEACLPRGDWQDTGLCTAAEERSIFNVLRRLGFRIRMFLGLTRKPLAHR